MQYKLVGIRKEHQETQKELAKLLGISEATYRNKELGKVQFGLQEMFDIASHYEMSIDNIFLPSKFTFCEQREKIKR